MNLCKHHVELNALHHLRVTRVVSGCINTEEVHDSVEIVREDDTLSKHSLKIDRSKLLAEPSFINPLRDSSHGC